MIPITIKLRLVYAPRRGQATGLTAIKTFRMEYLPPVGTKFCVRGSKDVEISADVKEVWWGEDFAEVYTNPLVYSDGDLSVVMEQHLQLLTNDHWQVV